MRLFSSLTRYSVAQSPAGIGQGMILAGYFGSPGNHPTRYAEENPFEPALGHLYGPKLAITTVD
jgi:hypothetical protein